VLVAARSCPAGGGLGKGVGGDPAPAGVPAQFDGRAPFDELFGEALGLFGWRNTVGAPGGQENPDCGQIGHRRVGQGDHRGH
jgi:hypothetical protein